MRTGVGCFYRKVRENGDEKAGKTLREKAAGTRGNPILMAAGAHINQIQATKEVGQALAPHAKDC